MFRFMPILPLVMALLAVLPAPVSAQTPHCTRIEPHSGEHLMGAALVAVADARLREGPGTGFPVIAPLRIGQVVCPDRPDANGWVKVVIFAGGFDPVTGAVPPLVVTRTDGRLGSPPDAFGQQPADPRITHLEGYLPAGFLTHSLGDVTGEALLQRWGSARDAAEVLRYAERLFALYPDARNAGRLAGALAAAGDEVRAESFELYAAGRDRGIFGFCSSGHTVFVEGSPYGAAEFSVSTPREEGAQEDLRLRQFARLDRTREIWLRQPWYIAPASAGSEAVASDRAYALQSAGYPKTERYSSRRPGDETATAQDYSRLDLRCRDGFISNQPFTVEPLLERAPPEAFGEFIAKGFVRGEDWHPEHLEFVRYTLRQIPETSLWVLEADYRDIDEAILTRLAIIEASTLSTVFELNRTEMSTVSSKRGTSAIRLIHRPILNERQLLVANHEFDLRDMASRHTIYVVTIDAGGQVKINTRGSYSTLLSGDVFYLPYIDYTAEGLASSSHAMAIAEDLAAWPEPIGSSVWPFLDFVKRVAGPDPVFGQLEWRLSSSAAPELYLWAVTPSGREQRIGALEWRLGETFDDSWFSHLSRMQERFGDGYQNFWSRAVGLVEDRGNLWVVTGRLDPNRQEFEEEGIHPTGQVTAENLRALAEERAPRLSFQTYKSGSSIWLFDTAADEWLYVARAGD